MPIFRTEAANDNNRRGRRDELICAVLRAVRPLLGEALSFEALERELLEISNGWFGARWSRSSRSRATRSATKCSSCVPPRRSAIGDTSEGVSVITASSALSR